MDTQHKQGGSESHDESQESYERSDAQIAPLVLAGMLGVGLITTAILVTRWFVGSLEKGHAAEQTENPLEFYRIRPTEAVLQAQPSLELETHRKAIQANATSYGWIDQANGVVRIPITRAMELILERGLPTRENPVQLDR